MDRLIQQVLTASAAANSQSPRVSKMQPFAHACKNRAEFQRPIYRAPQLLHAMLLIQ
uniref:Uncharacterized protein n=1 Tax=Oryza brachyantha TaxID=4533 RepID=J3MQD8_ORYBR